VLSRFSLDSREPKRVFVSYLAYFQWGLICLRTKIAEEALHVHFDG